MTPARSDAAGETRVCPHCRQTILASATVCPACRHHLRAGGATAAGAVRELRDDPEVPLLRIEGTIRPPVVDAPCEYSIIVSIYGPDGTPATRQVVGVGALAPHERRTFDVTVTARAPVAPHGFDRPGG